MNPVDFDEANGRLEPAPGSSAEGLPVRFCEDDDGRRTVISCWELSPAEFERLKETRRVYVYAEGRTLPPMLLGTQPLWDMYTPASSAGHANGCSVMRGGRDCSCGFV